MKSSGKTKLKTILLSVAILLTGAVSSQNYEHLIMYGQSLSVGQQSWPPISTENIPGNYMIGNQVWTNSGNNATTTLTPLISNVSRWTQSLAKTKNSQLYAECPITGMANHLQLLNAGAVKYIVSSSGTSGKSIEELSKEYTGSTLYYNDFSKTLNYAYNISSSIHCPAIVWMQGEYNYSNNANRGLTPGTPSTNEKDAYKALLVKLKNNMQADVKAKYSQTNAPLFITYQTGGSYTRGKEIAIGTAQLEASNEQADIVCAGPVYHMPLRGGHLDPNGYRWYGELLAKAYYKTKVLGEKFKPLQPVEISRTENPQEIKIKFYVPKLPLVIDNLTVPAKTASGFRIYLNGSTSPESIQQVRIENEFVILKASRDLTGTVEVSYGDIATTGIGNLRDSDDYPSKFTYIDLDKKNEDGSYVYERDAAETTLRPSAFEPKDADGVIYGKPYPLYNFCVAFFYKLNAGEQSVTMPNSPATKLKTIYLEKSDIKLTSQSIELGIEMGDVKSIELLDVSGKTVKRFPGSMSARFQKIPRGIYIVKIGTETHNYLLKHIVR